MRDHEHDRMTPPIALNWENRQKLYRILKHDSMIENMTNSLLLELSRFASVKDDKPVYLSEQKERIARIRSNIAARQDCLFAEFLRNGSEK